MYLLIEHKRNDDDYIRNTLKTRLREELEYLEEKKQSEMEAKVIMGDEYVEKICDVNDARKEGLMSGMTAIVKRAVKSIWSLKGQDIDIYYNYL